MWTSPVPLQGGGIRDLHLRLDRAAQGRGRRRTTASAASSRPRPTGSASTRGSRVLQFASVGFDVAVWDLCMALCTGGRVVLVPADRRVAGPELTGYLAEHGVTHMILPPSLVAALPPECELPDGRGAGGRHRGGAGRAGRALVADGAVVVAYGLTEATVNSTLWRADPAGPGPVPIGGPDPNTRLLRARRARCGRSAVGVAGRAVRRRPRPRARLPRAGPG